MPLRRSGRRPVVATTASDFIRTTAKADEAIREAEPGKGSMSATIDAQRVIADLRELAARTGTADGAQRLAWGPVWRDARDWFRARVGDLGLRVEPDSAGNNWVTLPGPSSKTVIVGSHLDSVPNGGWLDGA